MRRPVPAVLALIGAAAFAPAACTSDRVERGGVAAAASAGPGPDAGGVVRRGDSFATMSEQYGPRAGPYAATGASAWVPAAPAPAFVASGPPPPADPPAPDPIAAASRLPPAPAAAPAADIQRPEAAPETPAPAAANPALRSAGLALFNTFSCGACHIFADADASGSVGPSLDRKLAVRDIVDTVTEGQGAMPAFGGQMSSEEILTLASYLSQYSR